MCAPRHGLYEVLHLPLLPQRSCCAYLTWRSGLLYCPRQASCLMLKQMATPSKTHVRFQCSLIPTHTCSSQLLSLVICVNALLQVHAELQLAERVSTCVRGIWRMGRTPAFGPTHDKCELYRYLGAGGAGGATVIMAMALTCHAACVHPNSETQSHLTVSFSHAKRGTWDGTAHPVAG